MANPQVGQSNTEACSLMPTVLDNKMRPLAKKLLDKFGKAMTLTTSTVEEYDVDTGEADLTTENYEVKGAFTNPRKYGYKNSSSISTGNSKLVAGESTSVMIAALGLEVTPKTGDILTIDGVDWKITAVGITNSGELIATYLLDIRVT